jgi:hypothetical protein
MLAGQSTHYHSRLAALPPAKHCRAAVALATSRRWPLPCSRRNQIAAAHGIFGKGAAFPSDEGVTGGGVLVSDGAAI